MILKRRLFAFFVSPGILILLVLLLPELKAQQAVLSASNDATGTSGTVSYSVGQIAYNTNTGTEGFLIEGVQQPFEYQYHIGIDEITNETITCILYPNPAGSFIRLNIQRKDIKNLGYQVYNMNGFLLESEKIERPEVTISLENFTPAAYTLTVSENNHAVKSYTFIRK
jgi:hypothetical protein